MPHENTINIACVVSEHSEPCLTWKYKRERYVVKDEAKPFILLVERFSR